MPAKQATVRVEIHIPRRQSGAVLVIALILLLVMTILALSASQSTRVQERMAGNTRDADLAFQSAETGMRGAEDYLWSFTAQPLACATLSSGCRIFQKNILPFDLHNQPAIWWTDVNNTTEFGTSGTQDVAGVVSDPQYALEEYDYVPDTITDDPPSGKTFYRLTARGQGGTTTSEAIVQSTFTRHF